MSTVLSLRLQDLADRPVCFCKPKISATIPPEVASPRCFQEHEEVVLEHLYHHRAMFHSHSRHSLVFMISFEQPSRWVQLILKENICHGKRLEDGTTPLQDIKILTSDARPKERSIVLTSHSLSSTMDEHALNISPSSYTRRRARAPTPRHHSSTLTHLPPLQGDSESLRHSGARSPVTTLCVTNAPPYRVSTEWGPAESLPSCAPRARAHASGTFTQPGPFEL
jgi:hypothetical protein